MPMLILVRDGSGARATLGFGLDFALGLGFSAGFSAEATDGESGVAAPVAASSGGG
jgi:hypothetical protein